MQDVHQETGEDLDPERTCRLVGGEVKDDETRARNPDRPSSMPLINMPEAEDAVVDRHRVKRISSPERWEIKQMMAANCVDKSELPDFDEETGLLPKDDDSGKALHWDFTLFSYFCTYLLYLYSLKCLFWKGIVYAMI